LSTKYIAKYFYNFKIAKDLDRQTKKNYCIPKQFFISKKATIIPNRPDEQVGLVLDLGLFK